MHWTSLPFRHSGCLRGLDYMDSELTKGTISFLILSLLCRKPMYGYEIASTIRQETNGVFEWKEGTLYPNLHKLEKTGLLCARWEGAEGTRRRKYYHITEAGLAFLPKKKQTWTKFCEAVNAVLEKSDEGN